MATHIKKEHTTISETLGKSRTLFVGTQFLGETNIMKTSLKEAFALRTIGSANPIDGDSSTRARYAEL